MSSKVALVNSEIPLAADEGDVQQRFIAPEVIETESAQSSVQRRKSRSRSRGKKKQKNIVPLETGKEQSKGTQKHWVPVEPHLTQSAPQEDLVVVESPERPTEEVIVTDSTGKTEEVSEEVVLNPSVQVPVCKASNTAGIESVPEDVEHGGEPWQIMQSKKKKRDQLQEALWRSPSASTSKAIRFRVRTQAAAQGRRLNL